MDILGSTVPGYWDVWPSGPGTYSGRVWTYGGDTLVRVADLGSRDAVERALRDGLVKWKRGEEVRCGDD